jgi:hypothetical protein
MLGREGIAVLTTARIVLLKSLNRRHESTSIWHSVNGSGG